MFAFSSSDLKSRSPDLRCFISELTTSDGLTKHSHLAEYRSPPSRTLFTATIPVPSAAGTEEWMAFFSDPDGNNLALTWRGVGRPAV
jgi:hypothetical protein